ncbi:MAG: ArsR family transcriptional regulator [Gammaproteobacteria bacterium]|nr:MAG: ArsR family transcriptional regulator [Gammaproteobacteria bacterium]
MGFSSLRLSVEQIWVDVRKVGGGHLVVLSFTGSSGLTSMQYKGIFEKSNISSGTASGTLVMNQAKSVGSKPADQDAVKVLKALGDDFRLGALLLILDNGPLCVCELTEAFDVPQPKVSRQLATLRGAGLVHSERRGQWIYYSLRPELPSWVEQIVQAAADNSRHLIEIPVQRLRLMNELSGVPCS